MSYHGTKQRHGDGKWEARAVISRKVVHVGTFQDEEDAAKARDIYILLNHPKPETCKINFPRLQKLSKDELSAKMPKPVGSLLNGKKRQPLSDSGEKFIHLEHGNYVFRKSVVVKVGGKKMRKYVRVNCKTMIQAKAVRKKYEQEQSVG